MPAYAPLREQHVEREVSFWLLEWDLTYDINPPDWHGDFNPGINVNLFGRVVSATPPYVMDAVDAYQGGSLKY
jgi:hypothetical protein